MISRILVLLLCIFSINGCTTDSKNPYVDAAVLDPAILTIPPSPNSDPWQQDIEAVIRAQRRATEKDREAARQQQPVRPEMVAGIITPTINRAEHPKTFALLDNAGASCGAAVRKAKEFWNTERPFRRDSRIKALFSGTNNGAYPSGHTACSRVYAEILGILFPAQRPALRQRADEVAWNRVIAGVHYPHDLKGGEQLAFWILGALSATEGFQTDLTAARQELKQ
jgi:acid phosphatase (class A)